MKILLLIRGAPGSGKTTIALNLVYSGLFDGFYEADQFFQDDELNYHFDPEKIPQAHGWCRTQVESDMLKARSIIVSNTFTEGWQMKPYRDLALTYGYKVQEMILCEPIFENVHGVPKDKVNRMQQRLCEDIRIYF